MKYMKRVVNHGGQVMERGKYKAYLVINDQLEVKYIDAATLEEAKKKAESLVANPLDVLEVHGV